MNLHNKLSNQAVQYYMLTAVLGIVLLALALLLLQQSLTCVDKYGCLLPQCKAHPFSADYKMLLDNAARNNPHCAQ